ncbi:TPA: transcriptional regulator [Clostridioides difficile]|nr:transcriptional regulator [Clostridioides difficile]
MIVGIIGPSDSGFKIKDDLKQIDSDLKTKIYVREKVVDTIEVISKCEDECDAIIFTGCAVYEFIKSKYEISKPHSFVPRSGTSIMKAFWAIKSANIKLDKFSIDVVDRYVVEDALKEFDIKAMSVFCNPFSLAVGESELVEWHIKLFEENKTDIMLTGFGAVYNELKERGYPVFRLQATIQLIKESYDKVKSEYALSKARFSQIAVEILSLIDYKEKIDNYYSDMIKKSDMDKLVVNYVRSIQGSLFLLGRNDYVVFVHKGVADNEYNYDKLFNLKREIKDMGFSLSIGIGTGVTAYQAENNAHKALRHSIDSKEIGIYLVDEDENIRGPLASENELNYSLMLSDEKVIEISKKTGMSCESVAKIIAISENRKSKIYDSKELAEYLNVSERSARRILNKIVNAGLGRICAKETSIGGGRPKNITEILF